MINNPFEGKPIPEELTAIADLAREVNDWLSDTLNGKRRILDLRPEASAEDKFLHKAFTEARVSFAGAEEPAGVYNTLRDILSESTARETLHEFFTKYTVSSEQPKE
ncbi:hypothetical protein KJ654_02270 [Patescibacteria group bacterium]|nr:hypothetical protein [Patescibacteria group bacterium]MBU1967219.1 hypothetical protein [Patescibacteria group bacterium]